MAIDVNSYFSNSIQGIPQIAGDVDLLSHDETPKFAIGHRITRQDGNEYVYCQFSQDVNLAAGVLVSADVSESSVVDTDNVIIAPASAQTVTDGTVGSKFLEITLASITADQFAGATLVITDDTGEGYTYRVRGNTATGEPTTGNIRVELYDKIQVALDATSDFAIQGSLYANLEIATAATDNCLAGINLKLVDVSKTGENYGWIFVKGVNGVLQQGVVAIGDVLTLSGTSGAAEAYVAAAVANVEDEEIIGTCLIAGDTTGHMVAKLAIS